MENGSGVRFQKSPFQPGSRSCGMSSCSASEMPEVWVASWRMVIFDLSGSARQPAMYFDARSSGEIRPSLIATARDMPPTRALAMEAVPCGRSALHSGAYHSSAIRPRRMTIRPVVRWAASALRNASSLVGSSPASAGAMGRKSMDCAHARPAQATSNAGVFIRIPHCGRYPDERQWIGTYPPVCAGGGPGSRTRIKPWRTILMAAPV